MNKSEELWRRQVFNSPLIWSQSFSVPMSLDSELLKCLFLLLPLGGTEWLKGAGIWYFPSPRLIIV